MELVAGETLAERIARGPVPLDEAEPLFLQIAEGLEAAHEKGIVHRDLKPANVKITPEGKVKILDFGLARLTGVVSDAAAAGDSHSPTLTKGRTALGAILGTAAYMSPEQARGKAVDKRTDIWAFGCCLYEVLTGKKAFVGETVSDIIGSVLRDDPDREALPFGVRHLVKRCLEKDPRLRMRDIGDVRILLSEGIPAAPSETVSSTSGKRPLVYTVGGLVAGLLLAAAIFSSREPQPVAVPSVRRATIQLPPGQTQPRALYEPLALSPDGTELVYVAEDETGPNLFLRRMDSYDVRKLPGTSYAMEPFFSPDGKSIGFFAARELRILALDQGSPVTLSEVHRGIGGSWGTEATIVYGDENAGLFEVPVAGGSPQRLTTPDFGNAGYSHVWPSHLPGGKVLFSVWGGASAGSAVLDLSTRKLAAVLANGNGATILPTGHVLFSDFQRSSSLLGAPVDDGFRPTRAAVAVLEGARYDKFAARHFAAVSATGTLVYAPSTDGRALLEWMDRNGRLTPIRGHEPGIASPRLSPAGDRVVFLGRQNDIWILDLRRGSVDLLVPKTLEYQNWNPIWTPDGRTITFSSNRDGRSWNLYEVAPGGEPRPLLVKDYDQGAEDWSPDGQTLVFTEGHPETGVDLWILPRGEKPRVLLATPANEFAPALSPDGRWMAYVSDQSGGFQVYVRGFPDGKSVAVSTGGGEEPRWSSDGTELYFRKGKGLHAVSISTKGGLEVSDARLILSQPFDRNTYRDRAAYDVARDGRFLVVTNTWNTELRVVFDWFDELKRLVPNN
jgi:eukaryotic-like serine/threonine-protein kinase